jgi:hypothetical protein
MESVSIRAAKNAALLDQRRWLSSQKANFSAFWRIETKAL